MSCFLWLVLFADSQGLVHEANNNFAAGKLQAAEKKCLEALVNSPESNLIEYNLGTIYVAQKDYAKARTHLQKALQTRDPELESKIKFNLGDTSFLDAQTGLKDLSDPEKVKRTVGLLRQAIGYWRDVLKLKPNHKDSKHNIIVTMYILKDYLDRVKRHREEQKKKEDDKKGKSLADLLKELIKKQTDEQKRTGETINFSKEKQSFIPQEKKLEEISNLLKKASVKDNAGKKAQIQKAQQKITSLLSDPAFVEGASSVQQAENSLKGQKIKPEKAAEALGDALKSIQEQIKGKDDKAKEGQQTGVKNQAEINGKTQGVILGIQSKITGGIQTAGTKQNPGQKSPQKQGPPLPPKMKELLGKVKKTVELAGQHQAEALKQLKKGYDNIVQLAEASAEQQKSAEKLKEALNLLPKKKQDQKQNQKQNKKQQKKKQDQNNKQQNKGEQKKKQKVSLSRKQAENMLRQMKEKERKKKQEKQKQLLKAMGRQKVDKDW